MMSTVVFKYLYQWIDFQKNDLLIQNNQNAPQDFLSVLLPPQQPPPFSFLFNFVA